MASGLKPALRKKVHFNLRLASISQPAVGIAAEDEIHEPQCVIRGCLK
jgi:hypothetical protein